ncbi:MAG: SpoIIE family protein phosphatase [Ignavibacteria bacterium]|nr:SpoIIE family protein phosphatase [Ignavibacteria bacterium]
MNEGIKKLSRKSLEALIQAFEFISSPLEPDEILKIVLEQISNLLDAEAGSIFLINEKRNVLELKVATNLTQDEIEKIKIPIGKGLAGFVAEKDQLVNIHDVTKDERFYSNIDHITGFTTKSILTVPLKTSDKIVGVIQALNKKNGKHFDDEDEILITEFSRLVGLTLEKAWFLSQLIEKQTFEVDLTIASKIQESLLPKNELRIDDVLIKGFYKPARYISGDYFDFFVLNNDQILIVLGDAAGKGAQASLIMASVKAYLSAAIESKLDFITISNNLNKFLAVNTPLDKFITIFLGLINLKENKISYINCGHEPGLIVSENGEVEFLHSNNIIMGVLENFEYLPSEVSFSKNSFLFIYTDGVTEANDKFDNRFGNENLMKVIIENSKTPLKIFQKLPEAIQKFVGEKDQFDDITFIAVLRGENFLSNAHIEE